MIERCAAKLYGNNWNGPDYKRPGEEMKDVWRNLVCATLIESGHAELVAALKEARPILAQWVAMADPSCECTSCCVSRARLARIDAALRKAGEP